MPEAQAEEEEEGLSVPEAQAEEEEDEMPSQEAVTSTKDMPKKVPQTTSTFPPQGDYSWSSLLEWSSNFLHSLVMARGGGLFSTHGNQVDLALSALRALDLEPI